MAYNDLREFILALERAGELRRISLGSIRTSRSPSSPTGR
jgi:hypothetical protein